MPWMLLSFYVDEDGVGEPKIQGTPRRLQRRGFGKACVRDLCQEIDLDTLEGHSEPMTATPSLALWTWTSGAGKVHEPILGEVAGQGPAKNFAALSLSENWGDYSLCERCCGKPDGCGKPCGSEEVTRTGSSSDVQGGAHLSRS